MLRIILKMSRASLLVSSHSFAIIAAGFLAATGVFGTLWFQAERAHDQFQRAVETRATWTRFDPPIEITCGRSCKRWVIPATFSYPVADSTFTGRLKLSKSGFETYPQEVGGQFRVFYEAQAPARVVRRLERPKTNVTQLRVATFICAALAFLSIGLALRSLGRSLLKGE